MKPSKLYEALHALIGERVPLHVWGACGVGKSQIVSQVANDLDYDLTRSIFGVCRGSPKTRPNGCRPSFFPPAARASSFSTS